MSDTKPEINKADKELAEALQTQYREALLVAEPYYRRAYEIQEMYEGRKFDSGTGSDIRFPLIYQLTEELLPGIWKGLFPRDKMIRLSERYDSGADGERIFKAESFLHFLIKHSGLRTQGLSTVKDGIKFGKGYGIVEPSRQTIPEEVVLMMINAARGDIAAERQIVKSVRYLPKYRYIDYPFVTPTPDGDTPESCSGLFVLRFYSESELRDMYEADLGLPDEHRRMKLDAETVLKETEAQHLDYGRFPLYWVMATVAGMDDRLKRYRTLGEIQKMMSRHIDKGRMLRVPVLQCKYENEEHWIANGQQLIYSVTGDKKVCKDVVAASCNVDSGDWWAQGPVTAAGDLHWATNVLWRMLLDVAARAGDPVKLVNTAVLPDAPDEIEPGTTLRSRVPGDMRAAFTYAQGPQLPEGFANLTQGFQEQASRTVGRPIQLSGQGGAGIMRGGSSAFETWLSTATGREKLMSGLVQAGWLVPAIELIMRQEQLVMPARMRFAVEDGQRAEKRIMEITREDFAREYDVEIDPDAKYDLSTAELAMRLNQYQILRDDPYFDQVKVKEYVLGDSPAIARLRATPEVRQRQTEELQARAQAEQEAQQGAQGAEMQGVQGGLARQGEPRESV